MRSAGLPTFRKNLLEPQKSPLDTCANDVPEMSTPPHIMPVMGGCLLATGHFWA